MHQDATYWIALANLTDPGQLRKLYHHFPDGASAWQAPAHELQTLGLTKVTAEQLKINQEKQPPEVYATKLEAAGIQAITITDPNYPSRLKEIYDAPVVLFYSGALPTTNELALAIVGTRRFSQYAKTVTLQLTRALARSNIVIVSGLARGIDGLVHEATLEVGGRTTAVLGSSIREADIYPGEHRNLASRIVRTGGLILSEYPPGVGPAKHHFPARNRIIAGLTKGTLVIEAPERSGALITARQALEYNREVMAVPGPIFEPNSVGGNDLIKLGARVVTSVDDILEALQLERTQPQPTRTINTLSTSEQTVLAALTKQPLHIDELCNRTALTLTELLSTMSMLEMKDFVRDIGGKNFIRLAH
ncbi:MAG: DNA-processing protein DprA [Patescibacteria group bacterium]|jgi:DNA processing protein